MKWFFLASRLTKEKCFFLNLSSYEDVAVSGWLSAVSHNVWVRNASARIHRLRFDSGVGSLCRAKAFGGKGRWSHGCERGSWKG